MPTYTTASGVKNFVQTALTDASVNEVIDLVESDLIDIIGYTPATTDKTMGLAVNLKCACIIQGRDPTAIAEGSYRQSNDAHWGTWEYRLRLVDKAVASLRNKDLGTTVPPFIWVNQPEE